MANRLNCNSRRFHFKKLINCVKLFCVGFRFDSICFFFVLTICCGRSRIWRAIGCRCVTRVGRCQLAYDLAKWHRIVDSLFVARMQRGCPIVVVIVVVFIIFFDLVVTEATQSTAFDVHFADFIIIVVILFVAIDQLSILSQACNICFSHLRFDFEFFIHSFIN